MLRVIIYPELHESHFSDENFKSILMWKGFSDNPIGGRELKCPYKCFMTENRESGVLSLVKIV